MSTTADRLLIAMGLHGVESGAYGDGFDSLPDIEQQHYLDRADALLEAHRTKYATGDPRNRQPEGE